MLDMTPRLVGFFPKRNDYENPFADQGIVEICSVSQCIRRGPEEWVELWKHNDVGFYNSEEMALSIIAGEENDYTLFAYKLFLFCYENGVLKTETARLSEARALNLSADLSGYVSVGFDVASHLPSVIHFECSALSCNCGFREFDVNAYCLLPNLDSAMAAQKKISERNYEPGEQYLLQVYKQPDVDGSP